ncbi:MAG: ABC transporter ATP-binding protein [Clostridium neonatale]
MNMIEINKITMDFKVQKEQIQSLKEYLVNLFKGKLTYESFRALTDVDIKIKKGEVVGIVGRNGAGKSTLLKIIAGVLTPTEGSVKINGVIAPMLELGAGFDQDLTARENIYLNGAILGYSKEFLESKYDEIVEFSELDGFIDQPVRTFSSGMMMRLAFSIATIVEPEILIVDEILSVGDAHFKAKSEERMKELMNGGTTVLMVSHALPQIRSLCNRVIWLEKGTVKMEGETKTICDEYEKEV